MITSSKEYYENLHRIQDSMVNKPDKTFRLPANEPVYAIDLDARTIKAPTYLSVAKDHTAETIYFKCDRYFDNVDLSNMVGIIQYINANNDGAIYPIPLYDITTEEGKLIFPWCISGQATAAAGSVKFSVRFYQITPCYDADGNLIEHVLSYNLNTQPATSKVLYGLDLTEEVQEKYHMTASLLDEINARLKLYAERAEIYWIDLENGLPDTGGLDEIDFTVIDTLMPNEQQLIHTEHTITGKVK